MKWNPNKNTNQRRKRPVKNVATHKQIFEKHTRKSQAGVEYEYYKKKVVPL